MAIENYMSGSFIDEEAERKEAENYIEQYLLRLLAHIRMFVTYQRKSAKVVIAKG